MINLIYKFGLKRKPFKAPDSWKDVSFKTYLEYVKVVENGAEPLDIYSLFTGLSRDYWEKDHNPKLFAALDGQLAFLSQLPASDVPTHLERKERYYEVPQNFLNMKLGRYRDIVEIASAIQGDKTSDQLAVFPKMIAVIACKEYETEEDLERIAKDIWGLPCDIVYTLGCFFLKKLTALRSGTEKKLSIGNQIRHIYRQVLTRLVANMVIFTAYIRYPMEILRDIKKFFLKVWRMFTGQANFKVVSMNPREYTLI